MDIHGKKITSDRKEKGWSRDALLADIKSQGGPSISEMTLRRAETEGQATERTLKIVANALGYPVQRYLLGGNLEAEDDSPYDLNGLWHAYYLEDDVGVAAYLAVEKLYIKQTKDKVTGVYEPLKTSHPHGYVGIVSFGMSGVIIQNTLIGQYSVDGRKFPRGSGVYHLTLLRDGDWAEGFCTYATDDNQIAATKNIWLKRDSKNFQLHDRQVQREFKKNGYIKKAPYTVNGILE